MKNAAFFPGHTVKAPLCARLAPFEGLRMSRSLQTPPRRRYPHLSTA